MDTPDLRSKEEIARDIEATRRDVSNALDHTKDAFIGKNPGVLAWKATKARYEECKEVVAEKTQKTDAVIRDNIYRSMGMALLGGAVVGFLATPKPKTKRKKSHRH